jgi:hypothetical protein
MSRLFSGAALIALVAVAAPVWAQAPMIPPATNAPAGNPPANAQAPAMTQNAPAATQNAPTTQNAPAAAQNAPAGKHAASAPAKKQSAAMAPRRHRQMRVAGHMTGYVRHRGYAYRMRPMSMHRHYGWYEPHHHHYGWYRAHYGWGGRPHAPTDFVAGQLNRQELGQVSSGGGMPPGGYPIGY